MNRLDRIYIIIAFIWLIIGMILGIWLGATEQPSYSNSHAHLNLLGFVMSALFGLLYKSYPSMAKSSLALPQFVLYQIGIAILIAGKFLIDGGTRTPLLEIGSITSILAVLLIGFIFLRNSEA